MDARITNNARPQVKKFYEFLVFFGIFVVAIISMAIYVEKNREQLCFYKHLSDAVKINKERKLYYSEITNKVSIEASNMLIRNEVIIMPIALWIDISARGYINKGIPIVCNDFTDMNNINPKETELIYTKISDESVFVEFSELFKNAKKEMYRKNDQADFKAVSSKAFDLLLIFEEAERETGSNFCISRHVIESLGIAALHADEYSKNSSGEVDSFAKSFLKVKIFGLSDYVLDIDRAAQKSHKLGVGVVCNDVPQIPFRKEYLSSI